MKKNQKNGKEKKRMNIKMDEEKLQQLRVEDIVRKLLKNIKETDVGKNNVVFHKEYYK